MKGFHHRVASGWGTAYLGSIDTTCAAGAICNTDGVCAWTDGDDATYYNLPRVDGRRCAYNSGSPAYESSAVCWVFNERGELSQARPDATTGNCPVTSRAGGSSGSGGGSGGSSGGSSGSSGTTTCSSGCYFRTNGVGNADCSAIMQNQSVAESYWPGSVEWCRSTCCS